MKQYEWMDLLFVVFALFLAGLMINTLVFFVNVWDCNNLIDEGYLITHKTTFMNLDCKVMTKYGINISTNLLSEMGITKDDFVKEDFE